MANVLHIKRDSHQKLWLKFKSTQYPNISHPNPGHWVKQEKRTLSATDLQISVCTCDISILYSFESVTKCTHTHFPKKSGKLLKRRNQVILMTSFRKHEENTVAIHEQISHQPSPGRLTIQGTLLLICMETAGSSRGREEQQLLKGEVLAKEGPSCSHPEPSWTFSLPRRRDPVRLSSALTS